MCSEYFDGNDAKKRQQEGEDVEGKQYRQRIIPMGIEDPVRQFYEWQKRNITVGSWAKKMKEKLRKIGLAYIWNNRHKNTNKFGTFLKKGCNGI
jgi:hypothetical protein